MNDAVGLWPKVPFVLLFSSLLLFGIWPGLLTEKIKPGAEIIVQMATGQPTPTVTTHTESGKASGGSNPKKH
jgi:hypothetical protein